MARQGGSYQTQKGKPAKLVHRTGRAPDGDRPRDADGRPLNVPATPASKKED